MVKILVVLVTLCIMFTGCSDGKDIESEIPEYRELEKAVSTADYSIGESIYVPIYSKIYHYQDLSMYELTATLSIHNVDMEKSIIITKVDYYDTQGELVKSFVENGIVLESFQTIQFVIKENDTSGGTGANFLVEWVSENCVNSPLVEALMISTRGQQGISFTTTGKIIKKLGE